MQGGRCHGFCRSLPRLVGPAFLLAGSALSQPQAPEVQAHESTAPFQMRVDTNVVTVRVVVRDAKGSPVGNLHKEDFRLMDNGQSREITGFAVEAADGQEREKSGGQAVAGTPPPQPAASVPQRFVALFFDDLHLEAGEIVPTRDAAWRYISTALRADDRVAIFTSSNSVVLDFTGDGPSLHDALFRLSARPRANVQSECPSIGEYQGFLIDQRQDREALGIAVTEALLCFCPTKVRCPDLRGIVRAQSAQIWNRAENESRSALGVADAVVRRLALMPGQRSLVLVSTGFLAATHQRQVEALIDRAVRQNVLINALDAAGLYTNDFGGGRLARDPDLQASKFAMETRGLTEQRDVMAALAAGTGGTFFRNNNDFNAGFRRTAQAPEVFYTLSFSLSGIKLDGKFHTLKVAVDAGHDLNVEARHGYFAHEEASTARSEVENLIFSQEERQGLPATVTAQADASTVTVKMHVDIRDLAFRKEADRNVNTLTFDTALFDHDGRYVTAKESVLELRLTDARLETLRQTGVNAQTSFVVAPDTYRVREIVRDAESQKMSALNCNVQAVAAPTIQAVAPVPKRKKKTKTMADWSIAEFLKAMPELKGLEPAQSQERMAVLLQRAGQNVKSLFDTLPDITARERIELEDSNERRKEEFNYLALPKPGRAGDVGVSIEEYRTNDAGKRVEPQPLQNGFVTKGVVSMLLHFHPLYLSDSVFRYLGTQDVDGHPADVVCFVQIPERARMTQGFRAGLRSLTITIEGVAWIDSRSYHIMRMRTELLEPRNDPILQRETTESRFTEVLFKGVTGAFWLPAEVAVTLSWRDEIYRNRHHYSQFQLFRVDASDAPH